MKRLLSILISGMFLCFALPFCAAAAEEQSDTVYGEADYGSLTFDQLIEMSDEELKAYSEEFSSIIDGLSFAPIFENTVSYALCYYDVPGGYLDKYMDEEGFQGDRFIDDLGIPSELVSDVILNYLGVETVNGYRCNVVRVRLRTDEYKGHSTYDIFRTYELMLHTNQDIAFVGVDLVGGPNTTTPLTFDQLIEMSDEELKAYSEEFSSIIDGLSFAPIFENTVSYALCYYDVPGGYLDKYMDEEGFQGDRFIDDLGIPSELVSDVILNYLGVETVNGYRCNVVRVRLRTDEYKGHSTYDIFRTYELMLHTNQDIAFVGVDLVGGPNTTTPNNFDRLLEMSDEELKAYSEEFPSIIENIDAGGVYENTVTYDLYYYNESGYYDVSRYLDEDGDIQKERFMDDLGIPSELAIEVEKVPGTTMVQGDEYDIVRLKLCAEEYKGHSTYEVYRTFELMLRTNQDIPIVTVELMNSPDTTTPTEPETQPTTDATTSTDPTTAVTTDTTENASSTSADATTSTNSTTTVTTDATENASSTSADATTNSNSTTTVTTSATENASGASTNDFVNNT